MLVLLIAAVLAQPFDGRGSDAFFGPFEAAPATSGPPVRLYVNGIVDAKGAPATFSNTGPTCCHTATGMQCWADDVARSGCVIPQGLTGGGLPESCPYHSHPTITNRLLQSENLAASWVVTGTDVVSCGHSGLPFFQDARTYCKLTDDSAAVAESVHQDWAAHGIATGGTAVFCAEAAGDDATQVLDIVAYESGGTCTGGARTTQYAAAALTTTPRRYCWTHTIVEGSCSNLRVSVYPADAGAVANVGSAYVTAVQLVASASVPGIYCPTLNAAVACGADNLRFAASGIVNLAGELVGDVRLALDFTPFDVVPSGIAWPQLLALHDGTDAQRLLIRRSDDGKVRVFATPPNADTYASPVISIPAGQTVRLTARVDFKLALVDMLLDGTSLGAIAYPHVSPAGLTTFVVGASRTGLAQHPSGVCSGQIKVTTR
jgi:hypothetical protein